MGLLSCPRMLHGIPVSTNTAFYWFPTDPCPCSRASPICWLYMVHEEPLTLWTVGHSTRTSGEFLDLLGAHRVEAVADVRRFPASRKYPHFNRDVLRDTLSEIAVEYVAMPELGGRRRPRRDSHNTAWRNESFRGYADYMETEEFQRGAERLVELARRRRTGHVRGSTMVAVSPLVDRRLPEGSRRVGPAYCRSEKERASPLHLCGAGSARHIVLLGERINCGVRGSRGGPLCHENSKSAIM